MRGAYGAATLVLTSAVLGACFSQVPIAGAPCPCPSGYCCENTVCVERPACGFVGGAGGSAPSDGGHQDVAVPDDGHTDGGRESGGAAGGGGEGPTDAQSSDRTAADGPNGDRCDGACGRTRDDGMSIDGADGDTRNGDGPPRGSEGYVVQPWVDSSPAYLRAIVQIGSCAGTVVDQNWVLTSKRCNAQLGNSVSSIRTNSNVTTTIDRVVDDSESGDDAEYLHLLQPITDVPAVPLYWGTTDAVVDQPITCYGYSGADLWAATLSTRPHAGQGADPNTFETARDGGDPTILPGAGAGGPCFFDDRLVAVDSGWLPDRTGGLETSFPEFRSWMVATVRSERSRLFQVLGSDALFILTKGQQLWRENVAGGNRVLVDATVRTFDAVDFATVYVLGFDSTLWRETPDMNNRTMVDANALDVYGTDASQVYVLGFDENLWREYGDNQNRTFVDQTVLQFGPLGPSRIFALGFDRNLWNENGDQNDRTLMEALVVGFQAVTDRTAYVLRNDFSISHEIDSSATATPVDQSAWDLQAIDDTLVYVLSQDGTLWRERGSAADRDLVDTRVARFQALDATTVYVLDQDGALWREQGDSSDRTFIDNR